MRPPNWRHLQVAHAVYRHGSIRKAAHHLGLVHSTVSRRVADLEDQLGFRLFTVGPQGVSLNPIVESLLYELDELSDRLNTVMTGIETYRQHLDGVISVTCGQGIHFPGLVARFGEFMRHHPSVSIRLSTEVQSADSIPECGILTAPSIKPSQLPEALHDEIITSCGTIRWELYEGIHATHQLVYGTPYRWVHGPDYAALEFAHRTEVRCLSLQGVHDAIAGNLGFGWLPEAIGSRDPRLKRLMTPAVQDPIIYGVFFVLRQSYAHSARHRALRTFLLQRRLENLFVTPLIAGLPTTA
ncbi:MAG: LysR family transcriptional regulator [Gammaproteobacteria bacterium]|nr:LysR family transcriptional regulator [Gammaproteobacteria bacterium]